MDKIVEDSGTGAGSGGECVDGEVVGGGVAGDEEVLLESVEGEEMTSDSSSDSSSKGELFSCVRSVSRLKSLRILSGAFASALLWSCEGVTQCGMGVCQWVYVFVRLCRSIILKLE